MKEASASIDFLIVQISPEGTTENFTTDSFKDLKVSLSSVSINGEEVTDAVTDGKVVNTRYYENKSDPGTTRIYLNGKWAGAAGALDNFDASKVDGGISTISVTFTVEAPARPPQPLPARPLRKPQRPPFLPQFLLMFQRDIRICCNHCICILCRDCDNHNCSGN